MSVTNFPPRNASDPRSLLLNLAREHENIEDLLVIVQRKDDGASTFATTIDAGFLSVASVLATDLALKAVRGEIVEG